MECYRHDRRDNEDNELLSADRDEFDDAGIEDGEFESKGSLDGFRRFDHDYTNWICMKIE
jgi:hypothetical protein